MRGRRRNGIITYAVADLFAAATSWTLFFVFRKMYIESYGDCCSFLNDTRFFIGVIGIPLAWVFLYFITGTYINLLQKSRLNEFFKTLIISLIGSVVLFFIVILDDSIRQYTDYYKLFFGLLGIHFLITFITRLLLLNRAKRRLNRGLVGFNTLIIGGDKRAIDLFFEIKSKPGALGYRFVGFIDTNGNSTNGLAESLPKLGKLDELEKVIREKEIEEVVIAIESSEHPRLNSIINRISDQDVMIKIIPDMYDILSGSVKMSHVWGTALIELYPSLMPQWQRIIKRLLDVMVSSLTLIILSPLILFLAIRVKLSGRGPIFYSQERIGINGNPFNIIKFRSMYPDAESNGPLLSSRNDSRITPWGKVMRKWRLDELPQFVNVIRGDMSIIGPRPERKFFIDQIIVQTPEYKHLQKVKPGITSWGMVKFGYAENVEQMIERMKWDLLYIENMSLQLDLKIFFYTITTILQGRGK